MNERHDLVRAAIVVSIVSVVWSLAVGVGAAISGVAAGSLALISFGLDSVIDSSASAVLIWRFRVERRDPDRAHRVEHLAHRFVGVTLIVVALYVVVGASRSLATRSGPSSTPVGVVIATASLVVLPGIAARKFQLARRLRSRALRGDGFLTAAGAVLALVTLVALLLDSALGWWWADATAALLIAAFLAREGRESLRADGADPATA